MAVPIRNSIPPEPPGVSDEQKAALVGQILRGELTPPQACERAGITDLELRQWVRAYTRVARRAVDDQVATALAARGLEVDEPGATELSGSLEEMGVAELIQTIQFGKKDAELRVDHEGEQSYLWCCGGDVVDAVSARLSGAAAVYRMLSLDRGRVHADFAPVARARTIHASTQAVILEAAKRSDECAQIRARLGDTQRVFVPSASAPSEAEIEPDRAEVLRAFDGLRSIDQVVHDSEFPDLETLVMIERLLGQQWLVEKPMATRPQPRPALRRSAASTEGSFTPLAASARVVQRSLEPRQRLVLSAVSGVAVVVSAFAIGFYSAPSQVAPRVVVGARPAPAALPSCGPSLAALPGAMCLDRAEVTVAQYQACVRNGACEPAQREVAPVANRIGTEAGGAELAGAEGASTNVTASATAPTPTLPGTTVPSAMAPSATPGSHSNATPSPGGSSPGVTAPSAASAPAPASPPGLDGADGDPTARCNAGVAGREGYPINCVTVLQARRYCEWRGGRLPTRSEWEFAATSGGSVPALALLDGVSEWTSEPLGVRPAPDGARERYMVVGGGLEHGSGGGLSRLSMNANAQGRSVGFRCVVALDPASSGG